MRIFKKVILRWKNIALLTILIRSALFLFPMIFDHNINTFFLRWVRWDGPHYIEIAKYGYQTVGEQALFIVFYPLYPLMIYLSNFVIGNFESSAILVSTFFSLIASVALYELVLIDYNKRVAFLSVWFLNIFPVAYFLQASYTESLFLTLSILCLFFFRKERFLLSGVFGALAALTRINGLLLLPILLLETRKIKKSSISLIFIPLGFFIYLLINKITFGSFFYFQKPLSMNWYKKFTPPWVSIKSLISSIPNFGDPNFYVFFSEIAAIAILVILIIFVFLKTRKAYGIYMLLSLLLITSTSFILSTPRYILILFPIYIAFALIKKRTLLVIISVFFLLLLFFLTYLYTQGRWAF